jgi:lipoprotein-releasing system ATP-binding protein
MEPLLKAFNLIRSHGDLPVLKGINLSIQAGEIVSIVGASGAGKSTLLHILGTLDRPDSGQVTLAEQNVFGLNEKELARFRNEKIGFVFQFHNLLAEFSALENVCLPGYIAGNEDKKVQAKAEELLNILGVGDRKHHLPVSIIRRGATANRRGKGFDQFTRHYFRR